MSGVEISTASNCSWGRNVSGVEISLGSNCSWGRSVSGVEMSAGSKCLWGRNGCEPLDHPILQSQIGYFFYSEDKLYLILIPEPS